MIALEQAHAHLLTLGLEQAAEVLQNRLDVAGGREPTYAEFLADLLDTEVAARRQRYLVTRTRWPTFRSTRPSRASTSPSNPRWTSAR